jgi:hypothetical protein
VIQAITDLGFFTGNTQDPNPQVGVNVSEVISVGRFSGDHQRRALHHCAESNTVTMTSEMGYSDEQILDAVGLVNVDNAIFIKQYGEMRTGTNVMRALITRNFENVFVLMHILGDKHSAPIDLRGLHEELRERDDPAWQFVFTSTYRAPSETTYRGNFLQLRFLKALSIPLYTAFREERLFYVLSIKNPYRWASSILTYRGWPSSLREGSLEHELAMGFLADACQRFNKKYRAWLALGESVASRFIIVHSENLERNCSDQLAYLEDTIGVRKRSREFLAIDRHVMATPWDFIKSRANDDWFDFTRQTPTVRLTRSLHELVTSSIDWILMSRFGYESEGYDGQL